MIKLLLILILALNFQSLSKADDIRDFEIEGMSIGDSALEFMSVDEIRRNTMQYFDGDRKYFITSFFDNLDVYDQIELYIKSDDSSFIIQTILAGIFIDDLSECLKKKKVVSSSLDKVFPNVKRQSGTKKHEADKTGKSLQYIDQYVLQFPNHIRVECTKFSNEMKNNGMGNNSLNVVAMTKHVYEWIAGGYR
tara:strand:- start:138 stop:716 length:579 start_codon:yes stop_codon:yes gene_type:complete